LFSPTCSGALALLALIEHFFPLGSRHVLGQRFSSFCRFIDGFLNASGLFFCRAGAFWAPRFFAKKKFRETCIALSLCRFFFSVFPPSVGSPFCGFFFHNFSGRAHYDFLFPPPLPSKQLRPPKNRGAPLLYLFSPALFFADPVLLEAFLSVLRLGDGSPRCVFLFRFRSLPSDHQNLRPGSFFFPARVPNVSSITGPCFLIVLHLSPAGTF